jgi:hypothetical protein
MATLTFLMSHDFIKILKTVIWNEIKIKSSLLIGYCQISTNQWKMRRL